MSSPTTSHRVLVGLVLLALGLTLTLAWPFASLLLTAAAFAGMLMGLEDRLARRLRGHRQVAATLLTLGVLFAIVLPLGGLLTYLIRGALALVGDITTTLHSGGLDSLVARLPDALQHRAEQGIDWLRGALSESRGQLDRVGAQGSQAARAVTGAVSAGASLVVQTVLFLIALFFFLVDGHRLVAWIEAIAPLREGQAAELLTEFRRTTSTVIRSAVLTALVQAVTALVGYFIGGAPQPVLMALVTFFVAFVPAIGAASVPTVTGVALLLGGHLFGGIFLIAWGVLVVGLVDNIVKPLFIKGGVEIHGAVIFFSLLGGIAAFGPVGLIVGPLVVSFLLAIIRIARRDAEHDEPQLPDEGPPVESHLHS
jgi:predicted PurR-regulated permease PerM